MRNWIALLKSGDKTAFSEVYQRYWPLLFRHALKLLQEDEGAKDVVSGCVHFVMGCGT